MKKAQPMLEIAFAPRSERDVIVDYMNVSFPRAKWSLPGWQFLMSGRWSAPDDPCAITVRDNGELAGVLGLITATRPTANGLVKTSNMTSWYVSKALRGQGVGSRMLELVTSDPSVTVTNFGSAPGAVSVVKGAGFSPLETSRLIWRQSGGPVFPVRADPLALGDALSERDRTVLADHAGLDIRTVAVETPDGFCLLILSVKQKHDAYVTHEAFYIGDHALFSRYARAIADSLLPAEAAVLSVDRRFVAESVQADGVEQFPVPHFYTAGQMPAADVDLLYTEIVLLGMKL